MSKMDLYVVFGQRGAGPGEFAPEALDVIDEYTLEESPECLAESIARNENDCFSAVKAIRISVDQDAVCKLLNEVPTIEGEVIQ